MNKRIGSVQTGKVDALKSRTALSQTVIRKFTPHREEKEGVNFR